LGGISSIAGLGHLPSSVLPPDFVQLVAKLEGNQRRNEHPSHEDRRRIVGNAAEEVDSDLVATVKDAGRIGPRADLNHGSSDRYSNDSSLLTKPIVTPRRAQVRAETVTIGAPMRILLVSQMYPGPADPDLGVFVANLELELLARGHEIERAVVDTRGGRARHAALFLDAFRAVRRFRPDVAYAHFLVPAGLAATLATRAPLVVTAHGQDVANIGSMPGVRAATRHVVRRAASVIAVSGWLRDRLESEVPDARGKTEVVDCGVDLARFEPRNTDEARAELGWNDAGTHFLCLGGLTERKNVLRLAAAFERRGEGSLTFVGDGPLRGALEGRAGVRLTGRMRHDDVPAWIAACDVLCQPSLVEPFGLATLEAMASGRSVVATNVGGPPEFVTPESGVRVDPLDEDGLVSALSEAAALPRPNLASREAAGDHDVRLQAARVEAILLRAARGRRA
jgi:glycosyltransferase involved in cell wall biosynthesis